MTLTFAEDERGKAKTDARRFFEPLVIVIHRRVRNVFHLRTFEGTYRYSRSNCGLFCAVFEGRQHKPLSAVFKDESYCADELKPRRITAQRRVNAYPFGKVDEEQCIRHFDFEAGMEGMVGHGPGLNGAGAVRLDPGHGN